MPIRMGGPRFMGKIQSVHRKVQLAKAKPYNLDKSEESPKPEASPAKIEHDAHIVPSSDEEHHEPLPESTEEKEEMNNEMSEESCESRFEGKNTF